MVGRINERFVGDHGEEVALASEVMITVEQMIDACIEAGVRPAFLSIELNYRVWKFHIFETRSSYPDKSGYSRPAS